MQAHRKEVEDMELLFNPEVYGRIHDAAVAREAKKVYIWKKYLQI